MTDEPDDQPEDQEPRRYPSTIGGAFYIGILGVALAGILIVAFGGSWRVGLRLFSAGLAAASVLRLVLPQKDAGMLAVRNRWLDVAMTLGVAIALFILSVTIPDQPV